MLGGVTAPPNTSFVFSAGWLATVVASGDGTAAVGTMAGAEVGPGCCGADSAGPRGPAHPTARRTRTRSESEERMSIVANPRRSAWSRGERGGTVNCVACWVPYECDMIFCKPARHHTV